jgi:hypothetical protein
MPRAKNINIPEPVCEHLQIDIELIQVKVQNIVTSRVGMTREELFDPITMVEQYAKNFSKEELLGLYIGASSDCGFMEFKLEKIIEYFELPLPEVQEIFYTRIDDDDIANVYKVEDDESETPDEESFI